MAIVNFTSWLTGDFIETLSGGTTSVQSTTTRNGAPYALRINVAGAGTGYSALRGLDASTGEPAFMNLSDCYFRVYFLFKVKPVSASEEIFRFVSSGAVLRFAVRLDSAGKLSAYDGSNVLLATGTTVLGSDTWYRIEARLLESASSDLWEVRINGTTEISGGPAAITAGTTDEIYIGKAVNTNSQDVDFYYADAMIESAAFPGPGQQVLLAPNAAGTYQTWTRGGTDSGNNWDQVDEVPSNDDTDYLLSPTSINQAETEAVGNPTGVDTVKCVKGMVRYRRDGASSGAIRLRFRSGSTDSDTSSNVTPGSAYATIAKLFETDPATAAAWVASALDGVQIGAVERSNSFATRMTVAYVTVDYQEAVVTGSLSTRKKGVSVAPFEPVPEYVW